MSDQNGHMGHLLAVIGLITAGIGVPAALSLHWSVELAMVVWILMMIVAAIGLGDGAKREFLAGTLRFPAYTQIYTALTRGSVMFIWDRICEPAHDRAALVTLFRAALTWRLYDKALLLAVAYPFAFMVLQWVVTGQSTGLGGFELFSASPFLPARGSLIAVTCLLVVAVVADRSSNKAESLSRKKVAGRICEAASLGAVAIGGIIFYLGHFTGSVAGAFSGAFGFAWILMSSISISGAAAVAGLAAGSCFGAVAYALAVPFPTFTRGLAGVAFAFLADFAETIFRPAIIRLTVTVFVVVVVGLTASLLDWRSVPVDQHVFVLFLGVFPLINAVFDTVSYCVTLSLMRRGLRAKLPLIWGVLDLIIACLLFLVLGIVLVAVVHLLNGMAGVQLLDIGVLFAGVQDRPIDYIWLYLMLFSTIVPTAVHGVVSLLSLQGLWPRAVRKRVAAMVASAPHSPMNAVWACLALGLIWTGPVCAIGGIVWLAWEIGEGAVMAFLSGYFGLLLWVSHIGVGAF